MKTVAEAYELDGKELMAIEGGYRARLTGGDTTISSNGSRTDPIKASIDVDLGYSLGVSAKYDDETNTIQGTVGIGIGEVTVSLGLN